MTLTIKTNNQERELFHYCDFTSSEQQQLREDYDWMEDDIETNYGFFHYKGSVYHLQDFTSLHGDNKCEDFEGWDGVVSDSCFSGVLIKLGQNNDSVVIGRYYS